MPHDESSSCFGRITLGRLDEAFRAILGEEEGRVADGAGVAADFRPDVRPDLHPDLHVVVGAPRRAFRSCDGPPPDDCSLVQVPVHVHVHRSAGVRVA